jgi:hypothetical protein
MANATTFAVFVVNSYAGNTLTVGGTTYAVTDAGAAVPTDGTALYGRLRVEGDIDGFLPFQFADPETLEGILTVQDLLTAEIKLTEAAAGATTALIAEELYLNLGV